MPVAAVHRAAAALTDAVRRYSRHHARAGRACSPCRSLVQVIRVVQAWCLGRRSASICRSLTYFAFMPVILLIMQLPITVNGLGTTQVAFVTLLGARASPARRLALSVLFLALGIVGSLPGGLLYAFADQAERRTRSRRDDVDRRARRRSASCSPFSAWAIGGDRRPGSICWSTRSRSAPGCRSGSRCSGATMPAAWIAGALSSATR